LPAGLPLIGGRRDRAAGGIRPWASGARLPDLRVAVLGDARARAVSGLLWMDGGERSSKCAMVASMLRSSLISDGLRRLGGPCCALPDGRSGARWLVRVRWAGVVPLELSSEAER